MKITWSNYMEVTWLLDHDKRSLKYTKICFNFKKSLTSNLYLKSILSNKPQQVSSNITTGKVIISNGFDWEQVENAEIPLRDTKDTFSTNITAKVVGIFFFRLQKYQISMLWLLWHFQFKLQSSMPTIEK